MTARSDFTWPKGPIHGRQGCCSMSCPPRMTSAKRWRSLLATAGIVNEALHVKLVRASEGAVVETASSAFPDTR